MIIFRSRFGSGIQMPAAIPPLCQRSSLGGGCPNDGDDDASDVVADGHDDDGDDDDDDHEKEAEEAEPALAASAGTGCSRPTLS